jgi:hypothetical protein
MEGILESPFMGRRLWRGYVASGRMQAELVRDGGAVAGRGDGGSPLLTRSAAELPALAVALVGAIRATIFDPALLSGRNIGASSRNCTRDSRAPATT